MLVFYLNHFLEKNPPLFHKLTLTSFVGDQDVSWETPVTAVSCDPWKTLTPAGDSVTCDGSILLTLTHC